MIYQYETTSFFLNFRIQKSSYLIFFELKYFPMKKLLLLIFLFSSTVLLSQPKSDLRRDYVWTFSVNNGYQFTFDDKDSLKIEETTFPYQAYFANSTISDENGNLLFQSNSCSVLDGNNEIVSGGEFLNEGNFNNTHCPNGNFTTDGIVILPVSSSVFYLLYFTRDVYDGKVFHVEFRFTKVIKNQVGDLRVVEKDQPILSDIKTVGGNIALVRHANGKDWWIVLSQIDSSNKIKILLGENGVVAIQNQEIGVVVANSDSGTGSSLFSPDGKKLAIYNSFKTDLHLFDFDRCTGILSNPEHIVINDEADIAQAAGAAFSPNSRFLYLPSTQKIYQYDMWANEIDKSRVVVGVYDGFRDRTGLSTRFSRAKLGADGKIYIGTPANRGVFHIIHHPNEKGLDCKLEQHGIVLPIRVFSSTMSHHPNYRLGPEKGTICDSLNIPSWLTIEAHPYPQKVCSGDETHFEVTAFGYPLSYQWQINRDNEWKDIQNNMLFSGANENYLSVNGTDPSMEGWQFRCIVQTDTEVDTSRVAVLNVLPQESTIADYELTINEDTIWVENKSKGATNFQWHFGDYLTLNSIENPPYYVYEFQEDYDSVYQFELLVQNECSNDWKRDSISINIPRFELDFEIIDSNLCETPLYVEFKDVSKARHRILPGSRKWWYAFSDTPDRVIANRYDVDQVTISYGRGRAIYNHTLEACDKFRCDTLTKKEIVRIHGIIVIDPWIDQRGDRLFWMNCRCENGADTVTWSFENGEVFATEPKLLYEFEKDSTYTIFIEASNPCETVYDTVTVMVATTTNTNDFVDFKSKVNIYPNPTSSDITIEFEEFISGDIQFRFNDLTGRSLETFDLSNNPSQQIQLSDYPSGVYFYQVLVDGVPWKMDRLLISQYQFERCLKY